MKLLKNKAEEAKTEVQQKQSSENDIDGVSTDDAATVVGVNSEKICKRFSKNGKLGWNWGAFFFGPYYFMYRKCIQKALFSLFFLFAASAIISKVLNRLCLCLRIFIRKCMALWQPMIQKNDCISERINCSSRKQTGLDGCFNNNGCVCSF